MEDTLKFSQNWNNKLFCPFFNTLRLSGRFEVGRSYNLYLNDTALGVVKCVSKKRYDTLTQLPNDICLLDTGYDKAGTINIICRMYKLPEQEIDNVAVYSYVFKYLTGVPGTAFSNQLNLFQDEKSNH